MLGLGEVHDSAPDGFTNNGKFAEMTEIFRQRLVCLTASAVLLAVTQSSAQTRECESAIVVDKIVASPERFKGTINVIGRIAKLGSSNHLFALSCEDECFSMPVRFSGTAPKSGSNVIVRGQLAKESDGRYVFNAESVVLKK